MAGFLVSFLKYFSLKLYKIGVSTDVETSDKCLYLFNDWRFLNSVSDANDLIKQTKFLIKHYAKSMGQSEVFIALTRPSLELVLIGAICIFSKFIWFGIRC